jgi:polyhydroxyalkanoate synthase subunit PhaC
MNSDFFGSAFKNFNFDPTAPAGAFSAMPAASALAAKFPLDLDSFAAWQQAYASAAMQTWSAVLAGTAELKDKRFSSEAWQNNPIARGAAAMYLMHCAQWTDLVERAQVDAREKRRLRFAMQQILDAASPANQLALNPEALALAQETQGKSITQGLDLMLRDAQKGKISQSDEAAFEVGKNVATTAGSVVFENPYFQLIEYTPLTKTVYERPLLIVPPCINKFYILDLQPDNSLVRYSLEQGHRVFLVSWVNPQVELAQATWDDYIEHAAIAAIQVTQAISKQPQINILGFCVGGTIISTALAVLAARGQKPAASLTLLTTLLDFSDTGVLDVFIDEQQVALRESTLGKGGLLPGRDLANAFSSLRPNELVWNYVVSNYLKGQAPPAFDLLYWNGDSTNLPGPWFAWYLRHCYLQNELKVPGALTVCGEKLDLSRVDAPAFVYGSREDHIVPWPAAFEALNILGGPTQFVLGASGHIAGVVNPPAKKKRSHWVMPARKKAGDADAWFAAAQEHAGSWWTVWSAWLSKHAGKQVAAPKKAGDAKHPVIEAAPGRYVKVAA